jgi:diguanylate cyclase (GGDEF)-like protein
VGLHARRLSGWQRAAVYAAGFLVAWQCVTFISERMYTAGGVSPIYPVIALDILLLIYLGWRWWPLIPVAGVAHWALLEHGRTQIWPTLAVQVVAGITYAIAVRYVFERLRVTLPLRNLRDVAWFCGVLAVAAPVVVGACAVSLLVALGYSSTDVVLTEFSRFVMGDATGIMVAVPAVVTFIGWKALQSPAEHVDPPKFEIWLSTLATALLVFVGTGLSSVTHEPVLDLSFVAMSWLAIRYGVRGAALGIVTAYVSATVMHVALNMPAEILIQSQGFLFVSSLMTMLLAGLTTERWDLLASMSRRAFVDELTGLPNRERLLEWLANHQDVAIVLVIMDVDDMRLLNQGVGRTAADNVLREMALRMRSTFPSSHFVARVSADEFAVAVMDERSPHAIMAELRQFFEAPFEADGSRVFISVAMGAVRMSRAGSGDEMLRKADMALDRAKASPSRTMVYSPDLPSGEGPSLVGELHRAVERNELVPFYQPIFVFDTRTQSWRVAGAEALLRWLHPERGVVSPASFIDMLERLAIGEHVGWKVMETGLLQAREWRREIPDFRVWVNLFTRQVLERRCAQRISELLDRCDVSPDALVVEINERVVASDEHDVAALVRSLREMGVQTAIDDFGTGGSSLGRVREVPADVLKIDRSFVNQSEVDHKAKAVSATVVRLASELGMTVVAEGVENVMQLEVMQQMGCEYVQGYLLGHPLPADLFVRTFMRVDQASSL